ncbi:S9 family peptidase [Dietzia maris]|uniref:S9 family peptidase n=1 Tax=Dietzia maris TaxID=37915 RepID=UPI00344CE7A6
MSSTETTDTDTDTAATNTATAATATTATTTGQTPTPPQAERRPHRREHHGRVFVDDYEWLRDKDAPATRAYLEAENAYTDAMTADLKPLEDEVYEEIRSRVKETDMSVPVRASGWWYFSRTEEGRSYARHCRVPVPQQFVDDPSDPAGWVPPEVSPDVELPGEQLLLDGNAEAEGHDYFALGAFSVSHDGRALAWATDTEGDERYTLRFRSLDPDYTAPDEEISGIAAGVTWSRDGRYVFYVTVDDAWRPDTVWRHRLGTTRDDDDKVFHEPDESYWIGVGETRSEKFLQIAAGSKITTEVWCLDSNDPAGEFWCVRPRQEGVEYDVEHAVVGGEDRFIITHNDGAPNYEVVEAPVGPIEGELRDLRTLVAHRDDVRVEGVDAFARVLVLGYREAALPRFALMPLEQGSTAGVEAYGRFEPVEFDEELYTSGPGSNPEWDSPVLRFGFGSFVTPGRVYSLDLASGERTLLREQEVLGGYDLSGYVQRRDWATAADGTRVPISLVMSTGTAARVDAGEQVPTLLYGYGSYETSIDPAFSVARLSLLDRGMAFAVAHVRGGGEMGRLWYENGKTHTKRNTFTDFVDCARHLVDSGLTAPDRLVAEGGSAGGLLMGAVANLAPELFAGIQAVVPFVDPLTSILMPELPLTVIEWDEWGDPLHSEEVYDYMASYAPYENIEAKDYPAILAVTSLNDTRVLYVEPAKWVARLRAVSPSANSADRPVLLRCEMSAGHGGVSGRYERWRQTAFEYAWTLRTAGAG